MIAQLATLALMPAHADAKTLKKARSRANHRIAFLGHMVVYVCTSAFVTLVAGLFVGVIVAMSWGIGLAAHGFFGVVAPVLRERWVQMEVADQVKTTVVKERRHLGE